MEYVGQNVKAIVNKDGTYSIVFCDVNLRLEPSQFVQLYNQMRDLIYEENKW